jgi:hypothetical protein
VLTVLGTQNGGLHQWLNVRTEDGREGWVIADRTEYVSGVARNHPYVHMNDGRDGSGHTAVQYAQTLLGSHSYSDPASCLGFVNDAFYISGAPDRAREMSNPPTGERAIDAYQALYAGGKIRPATVNQALPEGAIVFFDRSEANGNAGHVAIATGQLTEDGIPLIITSGWPGSPEVMILPLDELERATGTYLGYTTPEIAFAPGTFGGGS